MSRVLSVHKRGVYAFAVLAVLWFLLAPLVASADQFTGKVVGILDGDTISVLREGKAVKVRLYGVDAPEKAQAFGTQARRFSVDLQDFDNLLRRLTALVVTLDRTYDHLIISYDRLVATHQEQQELNRQRANGRDA